MSLIPSTTHNTNIHDPGSTFFFVSSCSLLVLHPYLFLCPHCPLFCLLSLLKTHNTNIHVACGIFFFLSLYFIRTSLSWLFCLLFLLYNTHFHASNPQYQQAISRRLSSSDRLTTGVGRSRTNDLLVCSVVPQATASPLTSKNSTTPWVQRHVKFNYGW